MAKNLLIVESPAKAKTIEKFLGKDFQVKSSFGHIRDLEKAGMGIDIEKQFHPRYVVSEGKEKVVRDTRNYRTNVDISRMRQLAMRGATVEGLAKVFGVSIETVEKAIEGVGVMKL